MPEEDRVFDVTRPSRVGASAHSKPVIVGHHPTMSDPMVRHKRKPDSKLTKVSIHDDSPDTGGAVAKEDVSSSAPAIIEPTKEESPFSNSQPPASETVQPDGYSPADTDSTISVAADGSVTTGHAHDLKAESDEHSVYDTPTEPEAPEGPIPEGPMHPIESLHVMPGNKKKRWPWVVLVILLLLVGAYLAIDSNLIHTNINLPVHFFKQKTSSSPPAASTSSGSQSSGSTASSIPAGFTQYKLANTSITFDAPTAWGQPTSTTEPGFTARGGSNTSDGTYAYVVSFATNKDVQIAVTSAKYLPTARAATYYDFLQWCKGTNDGKIYKTVLHYSTANGVDTPTTATCDQGPLTDATILNASTIVQNKTTAPDGKTVIGDLYTKNLTGTDLVVFRVKDAAMTNGNEIKQLLNTVQTGS